MKRCWNALNSLRLPTTRRASSSAVCTVRSAAAMVRHSSTVRTLEPISSPVSQHWLMKDSMRRRSAGSCAAWLSAGSSSNTSTSECGNSSPRP